MTMEEKYVRKKTALLNEIKLLNGFSKKHLDHTRDMIKILEEMGLYPMCMGVCGEVHDTFPDWFVDIIDYGADGIEIDMAMIDKLITELREANDIENEVG